MDYRTKGDRRAELDLLRRRIVAVSETQRAVVADLDLLHQQERVASAALGVAPFERICPHCGCRPYEGARFCRGLARFLLYQNADAAPETCGSPPTRQEQG